MSAWIGNCRLYSTNIMWHLYMTYVLPLFYLSSSITMFSRYYMSLFLILIFLVFCFVFLSWCSVELWKVMILSLKLFIFTCIRNRWEKNPRRDLYWCPWCHLHVPSSWLEFSTYVMSLNMWNCMVIKWVQR